MCQKQSHTFVSLLSLLLSISTIAIAEDLWDKSLDDLMNMKVTTSSKTALSIDESPGIITVITADDFVKYGYRSIEDALNYIPGVKVMETYWGFRQPFFRGIYSTLYNDKSLLMINGNPFWDAVNGSYYLNMIPIAAIERIEVVRGPGSTLYGTNAFGGVINIILKKSEGNKASADMKGGSFQLCESFLRGEVMTPEANVDLTLGNRSEKGYPYNLEKDEAGNSYTFDDKNNYQNAVVQWNSGKFNLIVAYMDMVSTKIGETPRVWGMAENRESHHIGLFTAASYEHAISSKTVMNLRTSFNHIDRNFYTRLNGGWTNYQSTGYRNDAEVQFNYTPSNDVSIIYGAICEFAQSLGYNIIDRGADTIISKGVPIVDNTDLSAYVQGTYRFTKELNALIGVRYNYNKDYTPFVTPRAGLVYSMSSTTTMKLLYGQAFRSPTLFERYVGLPTTVGDPDLKQEKVNTIDLALTTTIDKRFRIGIDGYYLECSDQIIRIPYLTTKTRYANSPDNLVYYGAEAECKAIVSSNTELFFNPAYTYGKVKGGDPIKYIPALTASLGVNHKWKDTDWSITGIYTGECTNLVSSSTGTNEFTVKAVFDLNAGFRYTLNSNINLSVDGFNLLGQKNYAPEFIRKKIGELQNGPNDPSLIAGIHFQF